MRRIQAGLAGAALMVATQAFAAAPDCQGSTGVAALVCADPELADEDDELRHALDRARSRAGHALPALEAAQRDWASSREACMSDSEPWACVRERNLRRTAELEARYGLIKPVGADRFACGPAAQDVVRITYFSTALPLDVAIARRGETSVFLFLASSASGTRYVGPGVQVWAHQGDARVRWGADAADVDCRGID